MRRPLIISVLTVSVLATLFSSPARAQQPLSEFLAAADAGALDAQEARAALRQAQSQVDEARARLLPSFTAQGQYQRNEFEARFTNPMTGESVAIQPYDSLTANFSLSVPLVDIGAWSGFFQSEALASSSEASAENVELEVDIAVVALWHQLVASRALVDAAQRNVEALTRNVEVATARVEVGVAPVLERARAEAELARARQALAEANLSAVLSARNLQNLTGLAPDARPAEVEDDMAPEPPLRDLEGTAANLPAVRAAREAQRAANIASDTAWTALLPVIGGYARESGSNAAGFQGANWSYAIGVNATWSLDFLRPAQIGTRAAQADIAAVRAERAAQQSETALFEAAERVEAERARLEAALAGVEASERAAEDARAQFEAGTGTQLDVIQADRDLFQAEVSRIRTVADLRAARLALRIRSGRPL